MSQWNIQCNCSNHRKQGLEDSNFDVFNIDNTENSLSVEDMLLLAICKGRIEDVRKIVTTYKSPCVNLFKHLKEAIHRGMICIVKYLISLPGKHLYTLDENGFSLLYWALSIADTSSVKCLIEAGVDIDLRNGNGNTALHYVVSLEWISQIYPGQKETPDVVSNYSSFFSELLLSMGANVNLTDAYGFSALHSAIWENNIKAVEVLLKHHANVKCDSWRGSPLHVAVQQQNLPIIRLLTDKSDSTMCCVNSCKDTPLHCAVRNKFKDIATFFLTSVKNVKNCIDLVNFRGESALHIASDKANVDVVKMLIDLGANVNSKNHVGDTPLICATNCLPGSCLMEFHSSKSEFKKNKQLCNLCSIASVLIKNGADVNIQNNLAITAIEQALVCSKLCVMEILLNNSVNNKILGKLLFTSFHFIQKSEFLRYVLKLLVEYGADVNFHRDFDGNTPLHTAVNEWYQTHFNLIFSYITSLLELGADVNAVNNYGETPLHIVLKRWAKGNTYRPYKNENIIKIVLLFLQSGADVIVECEDGVTQLQIVEQLESSGILISYIGLLLECLNSYIVRYIAAGWPKYTHLQNTFLGANVNANSELYSRCLSEIEVINNISYDDISLYDILCADESTLIDYVDCSWNKDTILSDKYLSNYNNLYAPIISSKIMRVIKIKERQAILNCGVTLLSLICDNLGLRKGSVQDCSTFIMKYLNFNDFRNINKLLQTLS